jgi:hypothetical protein
MKYLLILPLLAALMLPSCSTLTNVRQDINQMTEAQYEALTTKVTSVVAIASSRLAKDWDNAKRSKARDTLVNITILVLANDFTELDATNIVRSLVDRYGEKAGLSDQGCRDIQDAALIVDVLVGPIKLGIDSKLDEREQGLVLALLEGLAHGVR